MKDLKFIYFIQLSNHMWDDGNGKKRFWYLDGDGYTPNNNVDFAIWDNTVKMAAESGCNALVIDLGDGIKYESHPEIAAPDALTKEQFKKKLDEARASGLTPLPKLNFSTDHHCWLKEYRRMVGSDIYRKVAVDLIDEVCELFDKPELFHLGMDEEHSFDCLQWREIAIMRGEKVMFEDFGTMFDTCRRNGVRPWVWADYYWNHPDIFERNMPKDVMLSNWYYGKFMDISPTIWQYRSLHCYEDLERLGYDQLPTCSNCSSNTNAMETMIHCSKVISPEHLKGFVMAPWANVTDENKYVLMDSLLRFGNARKACFPELK